MLLGILLTGGCRSAVTIGPPPVERPTTLATSAASYFGTCLTGALAAADAAAPDPATTPIVHCELFLLGSTWNIGLTTPLAEEIRFSAQPTSTTPLRGLPRLALGGVRVIGPNLPALVDLWRRGDDGNALAVADEQRPLPHGTTLSVVVERAEHVDDPDDFLGERPNVGEVSKRFGVAVEWPCAGTEAKDAPAAAAITLDLGDTVRPTQREVDERPAAASSEETARASPPLEPQHELVRVGSTLTPGDGPLVYVVPSPFRDDARGGRPAPWCAISVELLPAPTDESARAAHAEAVAKVWKEAQDAAHATAARTEVRPPADVVALALRCAFEGLAPAASSRATIVYVTTATAASFAGDFALVASDADLVAWLHELVDHSHELPSDATTAVIGWTVERSAWRHVIAQMLSGDPPPEIEATVLRHAGAVGRLATSLEEAVEECRDVPSLDHRFASENLAALDDTSAATRVRAFDWLTTRGLAPAGFDPLAPAEQRRRALEGGEPRRE